MRHFMVVGLFCVLWPSSLLHAGLLYGADGAGGNPSTLYLINDATGSATVVGSIGFAVTGLAFNPLTGILYGSTARNSALNPGSLITVDPVTGTGSLIGGFGLGSDTMADLAFSSTGTLYGWARPTNQALYTIDMASGAATLVGNPGLGVTAGGGLAFGPGGLYLAALGAGGLLHTLDALTGVATAGPFLNGAPIPTGQISAMELSPSGIMFASNLANGGTRAANLITINLGTGAVTDIGSTVNSLNAIAFQPAPEPATWSLSIIGLCVLWFGRKRR